MIEEIEGVIVAGAGPVGLVTALILARSGIPVTLLEAEADIIRSPRAVVYHSPTVEALDRLGLLEDAREQGMLKQDYQFRQADGTVLARLDMSVIAQDTGQLCLLKIFIHIEVGALVGQQANEIGGEHVRSRRD